MSFNSFVKSGKGLGLAKKIRQVYVRTGYKPMPIDEHKVAIKAGRYPDGTLVFSVVDERGKKPRFPGSVIVEPHGEVSFSGDEDELRGVLTGE